MKKIVFIVIILLVFAGLWAGFVYFVCEDDWCSTLPWQTVNSNSEVPDNWQTYSSDAIGFSMKYDPSLTTQSDENTDIRFYKWGPTQQGQTEMYDGVIFAVRRIDTPDGWESYVNIQVEQFKDTGSITDSLHDSKLNSIPVKEFSASGLGDFKIIYIPLDSKIIIEISYMAPDPTNAGFGKMVDAMLSTFMLK